MIESLKPKKQNINLIFMLLIIFNILFPKSGIKVGGIPITVGNVAFFISFIFLFLGQNKIYKTSIAILVSIMYWFIRFFISFIINPQFSLSDCIGYIVPLCIYPLIYLIVPVYIKNEYQLKKVIAAINICTCIVVIISLLQAIFGVAAISIPGLTVNYTDYKKNPNGWWLEKYNSIDNINTTKIVSTYQNGNLLGANLLLLGPFVYNNIDNIKYKYIFLLGLVVSIILAGSRTMYVAIIMFLLIKLISWVIDKRKMKKKSIIVLVFAIPLAIIVISNFLSSYISKSFYERIISIFNTNILLDGTGRIPGIIRYFKWMGVQNISDLLVVMLFGGYGTNYNGFAYEMTYFCIFILGGIVGLIVTLYPVLNVYFSVCKRKERNNSILNGVLDGILLYGIAAFAEGGFWLPPTALNFWLILSIGDYVLKNKNEEIIVDNEIQNKNETKIHKRRIIFK